MNKLRWLALAALAAGCAFTGVQANASESASVDPSVVTGIALIPSNVSDVTAADALFGASKCSAGSRTKTAHTTYTDEYTGAADFTFYHSVTWSWNCTNVTAISHSSWLVINNPLYRDGGYLENTTDGKGTPVGHALAQKRVGICTGILVDGCLLERDPGIFFQVNGRGGVSVHYANG